MNNINKFEDTLCSKIDLLSTIQNEFCKLTDA